MISLQEINKVCGRYENCNRKTAIKNLIRRGLNESTATKYYNIWRKHYMEPINVDKQP